MPKSVADRSSLVWQRFSLQTFLISLSVLCLGTIVCDAQLWLATHTRPLPAQAELLIACLRSSLFPEPLERISFFAALVLLPPRLFWPVYRPPGYRLRRPLWLHDHLDLILCLLSAWLLALSLLLPLWNVFGGLGGAVRAVLGPAPTRAAGFALA